MLHRKSIKNTDYELITKAERQEDGDIVINQKTFLHKQLIFDHTVTLTADMVECLHSKKKLWTGTNECGNFECDHLMDFSCQHCGYGT